MSLAVRIINYLRARTLSDIFQHVHRHSYTLYLSQNSIQRKRQWTKRSSNTNLPLAMVMQSGFKVCRQKVPLVGFTLQVMYHFVETSHYRGHSSYMQKTNILQIILQTLYTTEDSHEIYIHIYTEDKHICFLHHFVETLNYRRQSYIDICYFREHYFMCELTL